MMLDSFFRAGSCDAHKLRNFLSRSGIRDGRGYVILVTLYGEVPDLIDVLTGGLASEHHPSTIVVDVSVEVCVGKQDEIQESGQER